MRKHTYRHIEKYNVDYRPLTVSEVTDGDFIKDDSKLYKHQRDYVRLMALFDSIGKDEYAVRIKCPDCGEHIPFVLKRNSIMVDEFEEKVYGNDGVGVFVRPFKTGTEEIHDLIEYVVIDGEQILWEDCKEKEKELVLDTMNYDTYKSIYKALSKPSVVANIPVRCSCGYEHIVSLNGLEAFLKVI